MKLMSILENDNDQDQNLVDAYERTANILARAKNDIYEKYQTPHGEYVATIMKVRQYPWPGQDDKWGSIELSGKFIPNMDNLTLPLDMLSKVIDITIDRIRNKFPELLNESIDVLNKYDLIIWGFSIMPGNINLNISEVIGVAMYNIKIRGFSEPFGDLLIYQNTEQFNFSPIELPEFSEDYKAAHDHLVKNASVVAKVYRKGTWKGHTYDLGKIDNNLNYIVLFNDFKRSIIEDGALQPSLSVHLSMGYPKIDGVDKWSGSNFPLTDDEYKEFKEYIKRIFAKHGITYMT
jgi:hypothetical protein